MTAIAPADVASAVRVLLADNAISEINIQTHLGNIALPVSEIWIEQNVLKISVVNPANQ